MKLQRCMSIVLISFLFMSLVPAGIQGIERANEIVPRAVTYITGDWLVSGSESNFSEEIMLTGNLIIQPGASLSFNNVILRMNCALSGQYRIEVQGGGALTIDNGSQITNGMTSTAGYLFQANAASTLDMRNSSISKCGLLGIAGVETSGMRVLSNSAFFENVSISGCANGLIVDSCVATLSDSTIAGNLHNGILVSDAATPGAASGAILNNVTISDNSGNGVGGQASIVTMEANGGAIQKNKAGILIAGSASVDMSLDDCEVILNTPGGGIWLDGTSAVSEIRADIVSCNISSNYGTSLRLGFLGNEVPARSVALNMSGNRVWSTDSNTVGVLYALATDYIFTNLTHNDFYLPYMKYGLHIGRVIDTLNTYPAAKRVESQIWNNNITVIGGGVISICATENITATVNDNRIFNNKKPIECGAITIGWFSSRWDDTTPENLTLVMKKNLISNVADSGAVGIKAIYNIWADIGDNNLYGVIGGGFRLGWIDDGDAQDSTQPWSKPTRNVRAQIYQNTISGGSGNSIWVYSSNGSRIYSNQLENKIYSGDGIKLQACKYPSYIYYNHIHSHSNGSGIKLEQANNISVYSNTLENNMYGIGFDRGSHGNKVFSNWIYKTDDKYGFYFSTNSLDNAIPANNTVNGTALKKIHNLHGAAGALVPITGNTVSRPRMSNLGQIIISNSTFLDITGNQASNGATGITLINVQSSDIHGNTLTSGAVGQGSGISLFASSGNSVRQNTITDNTIGLALMPYSAGNRLWENTVTKSQDSRVGIFIDPNGSAFDNDVPQNNTVNGEPVWYFSGEPQVVLDGLNITVGNLTNLGQVFVSDADEVTITNASIKGGKTGVTMRNSESLCISNVTIQSTESGLSASYVGAILAERINISGIANGVQLTRANATFQNSSINSVMPMKMESASIASLVNTTRSNRADEVSADSSMKVEWYLDIRVESMGLPLPGAQANMTDSSGLVVLNGTTRLDGTIPRVILIECTRVGNTYDNRTPYHLNVTKKGYSTSYLALSLNASAQIVANISDVTAPGVTLMPIGPSDSLGTSASTIWLNATVDDFQTGNNTITGAQFLITAWQANATAPSPSISCTAMLAVDGAFDSPNEDVSSKVNISNMAKGHYNVWIRGQDALGNWCQWSPAELNITDDESPNVIAAPSQSYPANLSIGAIWFNATLSDVATGNSNIITVEWAVERQGTAENIGGSTISRPVDGSYNEPEENVSVKLAFGSWVPASYLFKLRAMDSSGNLGLWNMTAFTVTDDIAPSMPRNLFVTNTSETGELVLTWSANTEADLAGYIVYRTEVPGANYTSVAAIGKNQTRWVDTGLENNTAYYYRITACDAAEPPNESPRSAEASARTIAYFDEETPENEFAETNFSILLITLVIIVLAIVICLIIFKRMKTLK